MVRRNYDHHDQSDPFFTSHESIMNSKTSEERQAMRETLRDIQSAVSLNGQLSGQSAQQNTNQQQQQRNSTTPIWEIRLVITTITPEVRIALHVTGSLYA